MSEAIITFNTGRATIRIGVLDQFSTQDIQELFFDVRDWCTISRIFIVHS